MPLDFQNVSIPFNGGIDSKTDEKFVVPGKLTDLQNGVFTNQGKIRKRYGWSTKGNTDSSTGLRLSSAKGLATFKPELLEFSSNKLYSYSSKNDYWINKGDLVSYKSTRKKIMDNTYAQTQQDMAYSSGVSLYAWKDSRGGIRYSVYDEVSGAPYVTDVELSSTGARPRCYAILGFIFVFYHESSNLRYRRMSVTSPTAIDAAVTLKSDLSGTAPHFDVSNLGNNLVVTYNDNNATNRIHVLYLIPTTGAIGTLAGGLGDEQTIAEEGRNCLSIYVLDNLYIFIATHNNTSGVRCLARNQSLTQLFAPTTLDSDVANNYVNICGIKSATNTVKWWYEQDQAANINTLVKYNTITTAAAVGTTTNFLRSVGLAFEPFFDSGNRIYLGVVHESTLQSTYFIVQENGTLVGRIHPAQAGGLTAIPRLPRCQSIGTDIFSIATLLKGRLRIESSVFFNVTGVSSIKMEFDSLSNYAFEEFGENLMVGGGQSFQYDGANVVEYGFHVFPEGMTLAQSASGGSMSNGTYSLVSLYEWVDNQGQRHRSAPSTPVAITVNGGGAVQRITATIPTLRLTQKSNVTIHLYSTENNGTIYYRTTSVSSPTFNDKTVNTVTIDRTMADTTLIGNEILYTTGGVIENIAPPSCFIVKSHQNRTYLAGLEDGNEFWFSKEFQQGDAVAFSDIFVRRVEQAGGDIVQLASLDDKLVIFKKNRIYIQNGHGPSSTGENSDFSEPQLITTDVGLSDPKSIVFTDVGLMFKSAKGIYLLDRSLSVKYIGAEIQQFNAETITSASLMNGDNEVRFTTVDDRLLSYNYYYDQWSTFTDYEAKHALIWGNTYVHLKADGQVLEEVPNQFTDDGDNYKLLVDTAWIKLNGLQGYQRVRGASVLGEYKSAHSLAMSVFYDYQSFLSSTYLFNATDVIVQDSWGSDVFWGESTPWGGSSDHVYQLRIPHLQKQKCQAIKFRFEDNVTGAGGESFSLSDLTLNVGIKRGMNKLRSEKTL